MVGGSDQTKADRCYEQLVAQSGFQYMLVIQNL